MRKRHKAAYVFLDHHKNRLTRHPFNRGGVPDIICVRGPSSRWTKVQEDSEVYHKVPHYKVVTLVEVVARKEQGRAQLAAYASQLLSARPDMPGTYMAWVSPEGYQILWSDASGVVASKFTLWTQIEMLRAFVYSLYVPPTSHWLRDPSIFPIPEHLQPADHVLWNIKLKNPRCSFVACKHISSRSSWGRRTNIFKHEDASGIVIIKDTYRDTKQMYLEEELLDEIHQDGIYPGVVRPLFSLPDKGENLEGEALPDNVPRTAPLDDKESSERDATRVRARLLMGSYGKPLHQAKSVLDILKAFYDAIEGMFFAVE